VLPFFQGHLLSCADPVTEKKILAVTQQMLPISYGISKTTRQIKLHENKPRIRAHIFIIDV
jgi:hypothetical protein